MRRQYLTFQRLLLLVLSLYVLIYSALEFYAVAWGSGVWLGLFSFKWFLAFCLFILVCAVCLGSIVLWSWFPEKLGTLLVPFSRARNGLGVLRWLLVIIILIAPVYLLQYTPWGVVFDGRYLRILLVMLSTVLIGWLLTGKREEALSWPGVLIALLLISGVNNFAARLGNVTSHPFSLGWSEGNRLWDYSIMFGRSIYEYPADRSIPVFLDVGRQFANGIPFLIPGVTIWQERLWIGLVNIIPYLVLGWIAFKLPGRNLVPWLLAGIWAFIFVEQGPIHPPLLLSAIIVALAWRRPLWLAIPLIIGASYFAQVSRYTWLFAPGIWAVMLEFGGSTPQGERVSKEAWIRGVSVGLAGIFGGYVLPNILPPVLRWMAALGQGSEIAGGTGGLTLSSVPGALADQPLLWYRLFPNATYPPGILLALALAVIPLITVLIYLSATRHWVLNRWQKLAIVLPLLAFLVVGLIISVKIGGGGDLHNMDMFIIGLMFAGAIVWHNSDREWITQPDRLPLWMRIMLLLLVALPSYWPYINLKPSVIHEEDMNWVMTLADIPPTGPFPNTLPSEADTQTALGIIQRSVARASQTGEVLFMDQRQLLTFGYVRDIRLVPEYDKKVLIDQAMSDNAKYFEGFYEDLAAQRFSLIITNPLHERIQTESDNFGEENNAWVKWVSTPVLCYYEPLRTLKKVTIQLLVPRQDISQCGQLLPLAERE